ncbi:MAG: SpoIIE family protein phosphatase [Anaerolineales bacterium]|jgi:sigma-B regulation protein RsbU (phosphoserine phosphatase)
MTQNKVDAQKNSSQSSTKGDILVVDDTPANLRLLSQMLNEQGYNVRPVLEGRLALAAAQAKPPDLILLDIRMPDLNGYQVCERLKSDSQTKDIPIIFISALDAIQDKVKAFTVGGVDYITKPFHVEEVLARVETHLALHKLQEQLEHANQKMTQELALAGEVQEGFFLQELPEISGWQLSIKLKSARETSGDFFDVIPLPRGYYGILMADVVDKGVAAALFMALSWSLFRTYAADFPSHPEMVLTSVNQRILDDTSANQFVTVFYGVLDPVSGRFVYANAGHSPPLVFNSQSGEKLQRLENTGKPLGLFEDEFWGQGEIELSPGDVVVIYTDGVSEAQNEQQEFFDESGLVASVKHNLGAPAGDIADGILANVREFIAGAPQVDDIGIAVLTRDL